MNLPIVTAVAGALFISGVGAAYVQGRGDGGDKCQGQIARDREVTRMASEAAAATTAEALSKIEVKNVYTRQRVEREVQERVVYRECRHTADGLRDLNAAIVGAEPQSAGGGIVPAASAPGR